MRIDQLTILQESLIAKARGVSPGLIAKRRAFQERLFAGLMSAEGEKEALLIATAAVAQAVGDDVIPADAASGIVHQVTSPWFLQALGYDPVPTLRKLRKPVLVLNGSLDLQVPPKENLALVREALKDNQAATILELPNLNHLFQAAKTGSPVEYGQIEETISPEALNVIADWLAARLTSGLFGKADGSSRLRNRRREVSVRLSTGSTVTRAGNAVIYGCGGLSWPEL
jgi:uncharacterized protein